MIAPPALRVRHDEGTRAVTLALSLAVWRLGDKPEQPHESLQTNVRDAYRVVLNADKERHMKRRTVAWKFLVTVFAGMVVLGYVPKVQAGEDEQKTCSNATLRGSFGLHATGSRSGSPVAAVGKVTFDGQGNVQSSATRSFNGVISRVVEVGTYTVNPDCTGSMFLTGGEIEFVIVDNGTELRAIAAAPGTVTTEILRKQFPERD